MHSKQICPKFKKRTAVLIAMKKSFSNLALHTFSSDGVCFSWSPPQGEKGRGCPAPSLLSASPSEGAHPHAAPPAGAAPHYTL